jgi:hypothetical protein
MRLSITATWSEFSWATTVRYQVVNTIDTRAPAGIIADANRGDDVQVEALPCST